MFVSEALAPGDIIGAVHATDQDSGRFGSQGIRYTHITGSIRYSKAVFKTNDIYKSDIITKHLWTNMALTKKYLLK